MPLISFGEHRCKSLKRNRASDRNVTFYIVAKKWLGAIENEGIGIAACVSEVDTLTSTPEPLSRVAGVKVSSPNLDRAIKKKITTV